jgi:hypothetical protein
MSVSNTGQTTTESPSIPDVEIVEEHPNGHLVYTGKYELDTKVPRLFIHKSKKITMRHECNVYTYNAVDQSIQGASGLSADVGITEHGWFRDVDIFKQICLTHPTPNGQTLQDDIFFNWRASLLKFLDTHYSGGLWTRVD